MNEIINNSDIELIDTAEKYLKKSNNIACKPSRYKVGSLFAGVGGTCMGFNLAGAEVIWANEVDKQAAITYRENFGADYLLEKDICKVDKMNEIIHRGECRDRYLNRTWIGYRMLA